MKTANVSNTTRPGTGFGRPRARFALLSLIAICAATVLLPAAPTGWYDAAWPRRTAVTIQNPGAALEDFQVRVQPDRTFSFVAAPFGAGVAGAQADPIPGYLGQVSFSNLQNVATDLVTLYGPRRADYFRPYVNDTCTLSTAAPYPKSNVEMASDYAKAKYESFGYTVTMETVALGGGTWTGHNVIATKIGTQYPDVFIEIGGHLDTQPLTPGAGDNASGSTAIIELARVLAGYSSRYSIRFINFVGHEHGGFNEGSMYHLSQVFARGETIKAGLIMDGIGWSETDPVDRNVVWNNGGESLRIANLFDTVRAQYGINIDWRTATGNYSDNQSYWNNGLTAVLSIGGWPYQAPGYHGTSGDGGCHDTLDKLNYNNIYKTAQQNLAVLMTLDTDIMPVLPPAGLPVVAAVASSADALTDTGGSYPMLAFDRNVGTYWHVASGNFGYADKWLQADLGATKAINQVVVDFGTAGTGNETIANDFAVWVGDDPTFAPGTYEVAATATGNSSQVVTMDVSPALNGRWVRYVVTRVTGSNYADYGLAEMRIYGTNIPSSDVRLTASSATASSVNDAPRTSPINAFDGRYNNFWHVSSGDAFPKWVQADLGSSQTLNRVVTFNYGGYAATEEGNKVTNFQIWVGDDPTFVSGSYVEAAWVTGNDAWIRQLTFAPVTGRYVRFVVLAVKGTDASHFWNAGLYEMELWSSSATAAPAVTQQPTNQSVSAGQTATFTAAAGGNPAPTVQWQVNSGTGWFDIGGATAATLAVTTTTADSGKQYRAVFTNTEGTATSNAATLTVSTASTQLSVVAADASSWYPGMVPANAFDGNLATFWHVAQPPGPPSQPVLPAWLQADLGSPQAIGRVEVDYGLNGVVDGNIATDFEVWVGNDPGFAAGSYTVAAHITGNALAHVSVPFAAPVTGRYVRYVVNAVVASGSNHGWWSACMAEMVIWQASGLVAPGITLHPASRTVAAGQSATFTAGASGSPVPTVQWQINRGADWSNIAGATATTLAITAQATDNGSQYRAVFTNLMGTATTNAATLTVTRPTLPVIAAVASSTYANSDTDGKFPMLAFDGNPSTYWYVASNNFGYADKWLQADLGSAKAVDQVVVDFGTFGTGNETVANDFVVWIGNDPTFAAGSYQVAATITGNTSQVVTMDIAPALNGRWIRYVVTRVTGSNWYDYGLGEMRIYGSALSSTDFKLSAAGVTASSEYAVDGRAVATKAFDGRYDNFWHANVGTTVPQWVQADLGSSRMLYRAVAFYYGGYALTDDGNKARDFQILVGDDPAFAPGSYAVAASVTGNDSLIRQVLFAPVTGRYVRYLVTAAKGTLSYNPGMYELELWSTTDAIAPVITQHPTSQTVTAGQAATFTAAAGGNPTPTVQWRVSTDSGATWNDVSGATSGTLTFTAQGSDNGRQYYAVFTNSAGSTATTAATLTVSTVATPLPVSGFRASSSAGGTVVPANAFDGNLLTFWHVAPPPSGGSEPVLPSWLQADLGSPKAIGRMEVDYGSADLRAPGQFPGNIATDFEFWVGNDPDFAAGSYTVAAHVTGNTLFHVTVPFAAPVTGRYVRYVVNAVSTNPLNGGHGWWSACMYEMVIWQASGLASPVITQHPASRTVAAGQSATFSAGAGGNPAPTAQWQKSTDNGGTWNNILGATATALAFTAQATDHGSQYRAVFTNTQGTATTNAATLTVTRPTLPVIAAVASSTYAVSDTDGKFPMLAFDGNPNSYWHIAQGNYGYADKWLQADLGTRKAIDQIVVDFGTGGTGNETVANDFAVWIGNDPTFAPGSYQVAATITGNTTQVVTMNVSPVLNGRWVRYVVTRVTGPNWYDYGLGEMRVYGSDLPSSDVRLTVTSATASSDDGIPRTAPINAFDGRYNDFWHVNSADTFPKWLQADLGSSQTLDRVVSFTYGGYALTEDGNRVKDFQIWVGDDPLFSSGSYVVAASVAGNDALIRQVTFGPVTGRYVRFVVFAAKGANYWNTGLNEVELWSSNTMTVTKAGTGTGSVTSEPAGINCGSSCGASYDYNTVVTLTAAPAPGSTFTGWSGACTGTGSCIVTMDAARAVTATFALSEYSVTFDANGGTGSMAAQTRNYNAAAALTANTFSRTGYTFAGWNTAANGSGTNYADQASYGFTANAALYAQWTINQYTITFDSNGGSAVGDLTQDFGTAVSAPANPTKTGYSFAGWYTDDETFLNAYSFSTMGVSTTIYAKWTAVSQTLTFASNGGTAVASQSVAYNTPATAPADPTKAGNTFAGWYSDAGLTSAFSFSTAITADITLYAKWTVRTYALMVTKAGTGSGSVTAAEIDCGAACGASYDYNTVVTLTATPALGSTFTAWSGACTGTGSCVVTIDDVKAVTATFAVTVTSATVTLGNLNQTYDGTAKAVTVTTVPADLPTSVTYNGGATVPTTAGSYAVVATITDPNYTGSATGNLVVARATTVLTWANPSDIVYGTPLGNAQLNALASAPGTAVYTPAAGTILPVGSAQTLHVDFTPSDLINYTVAAKDVTVTVTTTTSIPVYLGLVSSPRLTSVVTDLVTQFGPRHSAYNRPYIDDKCTLSSADPYPKNNYEMAADYVAAQLAAMGYTVQTEAVALNGGYVGHNVIAKKTGSLYPNDYIEVGAHLDSQPTTPGAGDDASGSTAVVEMARVLKDYPNKYSIRFLLYVGHEHGGYNQGSMYHLDQVLARGERIKTGLMIDSIGWSEIEPLYTTNLWVNSDPLSIHIAEVFAAVQAQYGIPSVVRPTSASYSENQSYWDHGMPAVLSVGGTPYRAPGYHGTSPDGGCSDTLDKLNHQNIFLSTQLNVGVLMTLDQEVQPEPSLRVVAAVGSSAYGVNDTTGNYAMRAFDGSRTSFWSIASNNFGYTDKWLMADLGLPKAIQRIEMDFGDPGSTAIATDFQVWIGNEPTFTAGSYQVAASVTDNTSNTWSLDVSPVLTGRWVRYVVTRVAGATSYLDYSVREMRIYGSDVTVSDAKRTAIAATASSNSGQGRTDPLYAFDGRYNNFWHAASSEPLPSVARPQWVQADLGSSQVIGRVIAYYNGGFALVEDCTKARDFQIWIGDDPTFAAGTYTVAATVTGNDSNVVQLYFPAASGRYLRYVVTQVKGTDPTHYWDALMYELEMWGPSTGAPVANSLSLTTAVNTPLSITLTGSDPDNSPLSYSIVQPPAHGGITGTAPSVVYTPTAGFVGTDSFTFKVNDGTSDSNIATVTIAVTPPLPLPVVAAVASSSEFNADPLLKRPMNAFNGNPNSYWTMADGNWGYADKWLQADLGSRMRPTTVVLNWGTWGRPEHSKEALAKDFQIWIGDDPAFPAGSYTVAASVTDFTDPDNDGIATLAFGAPIDGRWVRYVVTRVTGTMYWDYALGEMEIYGTSLPADGTRLVATGATAKSYSGTQLPTLAFDGRYDTFWHVNQSDTTSPWWVQADLGSAQTINRVLANYNGGYAAVEDGTKAVNFEIWVGNDPNFQVGTYAVAATVTGNDSWYALTDFPSVTGRYVRYVVNTTKGTAWYDPIMYELELWQMTSWLNVTSHPASQVVEVGGTASFSAAAAGFPTPSVQWQVSADGVAWLDVTGATATTYAFTASWLDDGTRYRAVFTNTGGSMASDAALLTVHRTDFVPPTIISRSPLPGATGVQTGSTVTVGFSEPMLASTISTSTIRLQADGSGSDVAATVAYAGTTATLTPTSPLAVGTLYRVTVSGSVSDLSGNPLGTNVVWEFTTVSTFTDTTTVDFGAGTPASTTYIAQTGNGEVILSPLSGAEFSGTTLPAGWSRLEYPPTGSTGGTAIVSGGGVTIDGSRLVTNEPMFAPGRSLEFVATFTGGPFQAAGFGQAFVAAPWAAFDFGPTGTSMVANTSGTTTPNICPGCVGTSHLYRIDWTSTSVTYYIDGVQVARHTVAITQSMRPILADSGVGNKTLRVDWARLTPYAASGTFLSRIFDAGRTMIWNDVTYTSVVPVGTSLALSVRMGGTPTPDGTWTDFMPITGSGAAINLTSRYIQYRAELATTDLNQTPVLKDVSFNFGAVGTALVTLGNLAQTYEGTAKAVTVTTTPAGLAVAVTYDGLGTVPTNAGSYAVVATITDPNYSGTASGTLLVARAPATVTVSCPATAQLYTGAALEACTASYAGAGALAGVLTPSYTTNVNVGTATASASWAGDANHAGATSSATFAIGKAGATVTVSCPTTAQLYTGLAQTPCTVAVTGASLSLTPDPTYADNVNVGTASASYTYAGDDNHTGSDASTTFAIGKATSTTAVTCAAGPFPYTGAAQTPCAVSVTGAGGLNETPAPVYANNTAAGTASASYPYAGDDNHAGSSGSATFTIGKVTPVLTWATPAAISYGTALTGTQLNATASVPGGFAYTPAAGTVLAAGTHTLSVVFTPTDGTNYTTATLGVTITVTAVNRAPVVATPAAQASVEGAAITPLPIIASDPDGTALIYSAAGLPAGLSINATTGVISGTLASTAADGSPYSVVVTVSDGTLGATASFSWAVTHTNRITYYVDKTNAACSDTGAGTSPSLPFCTLTKGAAKAVAGDTVRALAGTYAETVKPNSGTAGHPVTFSAAPGVTVTGLAGNSTNGGAFRITLKSYIVVDGFTITGTADYGIILDTSDHITISNNRVSYSGTAAIHRIGIYLRVTTDSTISGNTTDHNTMDGIRLNTGSNNNTVSNNVSFGNAERTVRNATGINVLASNSNTIIHNTVYANEDTGLNFESGSSYNLVVGNLTYGNGDHGIHNNAAPNNTIIGNTVQGNVTVGINLEGASSPGSGGATVMNNVMVDNGLLRLVGGGTVSGGNAGNIRVDAQSLVGTTLDYNLYYLSPAQGGTAQIYWGGGSAYLSLAAFKTAQPTQEIHGLQADPRLAAPAPIAQRPPAAPFNVAINTGNYHLTAGSAAIDSANSSAPSEPALDLEGKARVDDLAATDTGAGVRTYDDRGAYEFVGYALTVTTGGTGTGSVTSTPSGISCPGDCTEAYNDGTGVTLTAAPAVGSTFTGWSGVCTGTGSCVVTIDAVKTVTATFTVTIVVPPPTAVADTYAATEDMAATTYPTVLANDTGTGGTAVLNTGVSHGTLTFNANGTFTYKPAANYNGPDSFTYKATNGSLVSNVATVTITVAAVNDAPVAKADTYNVKKNTTLTVAAPGVLANDTDVDGLGMTAVLTTNVTKGTLALSANGSFTYTPATNATGNVTFSYKAKSTAGLLSSAVTVTLVVK